MHRPITIPPHSKMLYWIPRGNPSASSSANGINLLSSPGAGFSETCESRHLTSA
ncbi:hypothetical protein OIU78_004130 [Salix suchowensis]|nr:hypothetical protein OIU78_004130 [Salix suchowensis]